MSNVKPISGSFLLGNGTNETYLRPPKSEISEWNGETNENGNETESDKDKGIIHINGKKMSLLRT